MTTDCVTNKGDVLTMGELAQERLGVLGAVYDHALPLEWQRDLQKRLDERLRVFFKEPIGLELDDVAVEHRENIMQAISSGCVWLYPVGSIAGLPYPITDRAAAALRLLDELGVPRA